VDPVDPMSGSSGADNAESCSDQCNEIGIAAIYVCVCVCVEGGHHMRDMGADGH
jgi:hypothetical protein